MKKTVKKNKEKNSKKISKKLRNLRKKVAKNFSEKKQIFTIKITKNFFVKNKIFTIKKVMKKFKGKEDFLLFEDTIFLRSSDFCDFFFSFLDFLLSFLIEPLPLHRRASLYLRLAIPHLQGSFHRVPALIPYSHWLVLLIKIFSFNASLKFARLF